MTTSWRSEMTSRHLGTSYVNNLHIYYAQPSLDRMNLSPVSPFW
jgi:hypothetical protein